MEVVANSDDGIEFFGGTVNANNLLIWASGDDGIDIDQAYSGTISNSVVILVIILIMLWKLMGQRAHYLIVLF